MCFFGYFKKSVKVHVFLSEFFKNPKKIIEAYQTFSKNREKVYQWFITISKNMGKLLILDLKRIISSYFIVFYLQ